MTERARELLDEALTLVPEERADVAAQLLASLGEPLAAGRPETREAWAAEIERRARRVLSGQSSGEPWDAVRGRVAQRLSEPAAGRAVALIHDATNAVVASHAPDVDDDTPT